MDTDDGQQKKLSVKERWDPEAKKMRNTDGFKSMPKFKVPEGQDIMENYDFYSDLDVRTKYIAQGQISLCQFLQIPLDRERLDRQEEKETRITATSKGRFYCRHSNSKTHQKTVQESPAMDRRTFSLHVRKRSFLILFLLYKVSYTTISP